MSRSNWVIIGDENKTGSPKVHVSASDYDLEAPLSHLIEKQRRLSSQRKIEKRFPSPPSASQSEGSGPSAPWTPRFWFTVAATTGIVVFYFFRMEILTIN